MLLAAYASGAFPMATGPRGRIEWYAPDPRGVLPLERFHAPGTLQRLVRQARFEIRVDTATDAVMEACAGPRSRSNGGWMSPALLQAYRSLRIGGHVHSVEAWLDGRLVGGLYGVRLRRAFFGESMFVRPDLGGSNSSKVCLVHLVDRLRSGGFTLLDTQMVTEHMRQFGAIEVPRTEYKRQLAKALEGEGDWGEGGGSGAVGSRPGSGSKFPKTES